VVAVGVEDTVVEIFLRSGLLRGWRLGRRFLRLGAAEGGDTSHVLGSFMKLCRCAGNLRAGHAHQGIAASAHTGGWKEGRMCAEGV